ncbi:MAG: PhoH family protein, partial [Burkholderiales bacterium]|nr:PhoH family protein [Burkholderiales bacterium]
MPLPKPPSKKASLLASGDFESQAAPKPEKKTIKAPAEPVPVSLDLFDGGAEVAARPPAKAPAPARIP